MLTYENIFEILMFPDMHWLYIKKRKALQYKAFRISNHPCFDKKVRNTGGVHMVDLGGPNKNLGCFAGGFFTTLLL